METVGPLLCTPSRPPRSPTAPPHRPSRSPGGHTSGYPSSTPHQLRNLHQKPAAQNPSRVDSQPSPVLTQAGESELAWEAGSERGFPFLARLPRPSADLLSPCLIHSPSPLSQPASPNSWFTSLPPIRVISSFSFLGWWLLTPWCVALSSSA